jgi:LacI family transcriptional regulator
MQAIQAYGWAAGWRLEARLLPDLDPMPDVSRSEADGWIMGQGDPAVVEAFTQRGGSVVTVASGRDGELPAVIVDHDQMVTAAVEHLREQGLRHLAIYGWEDRPHSQPRETRFFTLAGDQAPIYRENRAKRLAGQTHENGNSTQAELKAWLKSLPRPCGVFCVDDQLAVHLIRTCREADIDVPNDLAVIGIDDDDLWCQCVEPPLSSVRYEGYRVGWEAAQLLDQLMAGRSPRRQHIRVPSRGVQPRESTAVVAVDDQAVATALHYIREEATRRSLQVMDVVNQTPLSRSALASRFRATMGRSLRGEITRVRVEQAQMLLSATDWPVKVVAAEMGFRSTEELARFFRRKTGQTPSDYRASLAGA